MRDANKPSSKVCGRRVSHDTSTRTLIVVGGAPRLNREGYERVARRPRSRLHNEIMALGRADEIESDDYGLMGMGFYGEDY